MTLPKQIAAIVQPLYFHRQKGHIHSQDVSKDQHRDYVKAFTLIKKFLY